MEQIHEHVVVATSQCALAAVDAASARPASSALSSASRATALLFTVVNTGFDIVTFSADFRASSNIQLRFPHRAAQVNGGDDDSDTDSGAPRALPPPSSGADDSLVFDCRVAPFERKTLVHVLKVPGKRAFVRVQFCVKQVSSPAVEEIEQAQQHDEQALAQAIKHAQDTYYANNRSLPVHHLGNAPQRIMRRCCDDTNRLFRAHERDRDGARFVDASFPPTRSSLIGLQDNSEDKGDAASTALYSLSSWKHLHDTMDTSWTFLAANTQKQLVPPPPPRKRSTSFAQLTDFKSPLPGQDSLLCAVAFLSLDKERWTTQLFADQLPLDTGAIQALAAVSVRICDRGMQWKQVVVDLFQPGFPIGSGLVSMSSPASGEVYGMLVQKAYAKVKGSYAAIETIPTVSILRELTGLPWYSALHLCRAVLLTGDEQEGVTFQDIDSKLRKALGSSMKPVETGSNGGNTEDERLAVVCTWADFFQLEPRVWVILANHCEARRKRIRFIHESDGDTETRAESCLQFAFSVAEMTSLVISTQLQWKRSEARHQLTLDVVEHDFSLTRISTEAAHEFVSDTELQLVLALGVGEYILSVKIESKEAAPNSKPPQSQHQQSDLLTSVDAERSLQLLFDCIDQDMDGAISLQELQAFLEMHEGTHEPLHEDTQGPNLEARFVDRFGSSDASSSSCGSTTKSTSKELLVDDLRDVYHHLAASNDGDTPSEPTRDAQMQRYQELVWSDLNFVLLSNRTNTNRDHQRDTQLSSIRVDEIEEFRCCVHSDAPLVNFVLHPTPFC